MPQGRRKVPFSGKAKKEQLKAKRQQKKQGGKNVPFLQKPDEDNNEESCSSIQKLNYQPTKDKSSRPNRYALQFFRETHAEIKEKKEQARQALVKVDEKDLEVDESQFFDDKLDFPKRPPWDSNLTKDQLEAQENRYFQQYLKKIEENYNLKDLSYFELNLETWRQLWRVLEMSDILLFIVDIRYPVVMFPPSLYKYVTEDLGKDFILVFNKIDLAPAPLVVAWKHYCEEKYPLLKICMFTSIPGYNLIGQSSDKGGLLKRRRKGRIRMAAEGTQKLFEACKSLVGDKVDLTTWQRKIKEEMQQSYHEEDEIEIGETVNTPNETDYYEYKKYTGGILTIGCVGQPNVGKSSLMNAIMGKKVVSVSKTPGHTKHFQTIFLTENVRLCDCPGLVFPSKVPKPLQVLMGSFPIAQLREPYTTIRFLAERLDLVKMLRIEHPYGDDTWSAMDICDGWAKKKGYITAKAARFDSYRAANSLLRMALDGKICLCLRPPKYTRREKYWENHSDVELVKWIQAIRNDDNEYQSNKAETNYSSDLSSEDEDEENSDEESESNSVKSDTDEENDEVLCNKFAALGEED